MSSAHQGCRNVIVDLKEEIAAWLDLCWLIAVVFFYAETGLTGIPRSQPGTCWGYDANCA